MGVKEEEEQKYVRWGTLWSFPTDSTTKQKPARERRPEGSRVELKSWSCVALCCDLLLIPSLQLELSRWQTSVSGSPEARSKLRLMCTYWPHLKTNQITWVDRKWFVGYWLDFLLHGCCLTERKTCVRLQGCFSLRLSCRLFTNIEDVSWIKKVVKDNKKKKLL